MNASNDKIKLFLLNNMVVESSLRSVLRQHGAITEQTPVEKAADELIGGYVAQFDFESQVRAKRMSEYYELFHMFENAIRTMIADTLAVSEPDKWWDTLVPAAVKASAQKNREKEINEGVSWRSPDLIEYTNFGELGEIIKANWSIFAGIFSRGSILAVEKIMARLNTLRGPIAHCGNLSEDEVLRLKLTVRDWFRMME